jgi:hypothetical protein
MLTPIFSWSQANDWYFPPDIKMDANGGGFSNFSSGTDITNCTTFKSQQGVLSNSGGSSYRAFNACSIYDFNGNNINPSWQGADILFTVPGLCNQYWEVSWKFVSGPPHSLKLSIVKFNGENPENMEFIEEEEITPDPADIPEGTCGPTGSWDVAVSPLANDGSRTIFAVSGKGFLSWTIDASGTISYDGLLATLPYAVDRQVRMEVTSDGNHVLMNPCGYQGVMIYDLYPVHGAPSVRLISVGKYISGYEYVPAGITGSNERLYVSSHDATSPYSGGITYYDFNTGSGPSTPFTYSSHQVFGFTEIELAKDGNLYFAFNPTFGSGNVSGAGDLYYFNPASASSASPTQAASGGEVSTYFNWGYYIQRQIDGENYDVTDYAVSQAQWDIAGIIQPNWFTINNLYICDSILMLNALISSYHTSYSIKIENGTVSPPFYNFIASGTQFSPNPLTINGSAANNSVNLIDVFSWLDTYTGAIKVTITVNGCGNASSYMLFNVAGSTTTLANYKYIRNNGGNFGSPYKTPTTTLPITTPMPIGNSYTIFRANLDTSLGWMGASATLGIDTINTNGTYELVIYQVDDSTGKRYYDSSIAMYAPNLAYYKKIGSVSNGSFHFNTQTVTFDASNPPFYATGNDTSDAAYFLDFHNWAFSQTPAIRKDFKDRVYRIDFKVTTPSPFNCSVTKTSYFRIAIDTAITKNQSGQSKLTNATQFESKEIILLYPNPTSDQFEIFIPFEWVNAELKITNNIGQTVFSNKLSHNDSHINIAQFPSGLYFYKLIVDENNYEGKLIKK